MLKKKLCKRCWNGYVESVIDNEYIKSVQKWNENDEQFWKEGVVCCPQIYRKKEVVESLIKITGKPPENCPYLLEQLLSKED